MWVWRVIVSVFVLLNFYVSPAFAKKLHEFDATRVYATIYVPKGPAISKFRATFTVPEAPTVNNGQDIAIWTGLQPEDSKAILQPVLQWGKGWANRGGLHWSLSCWGVKVDASSEVHFESSSLTSVNPGDEVTAVMELVSQIDGVYRYRCYFEGNRVTELYFEYPEKLTDAWVQYEIQDVTTCQDYSEDVIVTDVEILAGRKSPRATWEKVVEDPKKCGITLRGSKKVAAGNSFEFNVKN